MKDRLSRIVKSKIFIIMIAVILCYTLAGFFLTPYVIKRVLLAYVTEDLGRRLIIGKVRTNPYTFTLEVNDISIHEKDNAPLFGIERLFVDFDLKSAYCWVWTFHEVVISRPSVSIEISKDSQLNLSRLVADAGSSKDKSEKPQDRATKKRLPQFHIERIGLGNGKIAIVDHSGLVPVQANCDSIQLELTHLHTSSEQPGQLSFTAALPEGGVFQFKGDLSLNPLGSHGSFSLDGLKPAIVWHFFQDKLLIQKPPGDLKIGGSYRFSAAQQRFDLVIDPFSALLSGAAFTLRDGHEPLLKLEHVEINGARLDLATRKIFVGQIILKKGQMDLEVDKDGQIPWQRIIAQNRNGNPKPGPYAEPDTKPLQIEFQKVVLQDIGLRFTEYSRSQGFRVALACSDLDFSINGTLSEKFRARIRDINLNLADIEIVRTGDEPKKLLLVPNITLREGGMDMATGEILIGKVALTGGRAFLTIEEDGRLDWQGMIEGGSKSKTSTEGGEKMPFHLRLNELSINDFALEYTDSSKIEPIHIGMQRVDTRLSLEVTQKPEGTEAIIDGVFMEMSGLFLTQEGESEALLQIPRSSLRGGRLDLTGHRFYIDELALNGGKASLTRFADGKTNLSKLIQDKGAIKKGIEEIQADAEAAKFPWMVELDRLSLNHFGLDFSDRTLKQPATLILQNVAVHVADFKTGSNAPFGFDLAVDLSEGGHVTAEGKLHMDPVSVDASVTGSKLALSPLQPYLDTVARLTLGSGDLSVEGRMTYGSASTDKPTFSGTSQINNLVLVPHGKSDPLLAFKSLEAGGIHLNRGSRGVVIESIVLREPTGTLVIREDRKLNLRDVIIDDKATKTSPSASPDPFPIEILLIRMDHGKLGFSDLTLTPPFAVKIYDLGGTLSGFSTLPQGHAFLDLEGRVENYGLSSIKGELRPFKVMEYSIIFMKFQNIEMSALSPYGARFAGRKITSGKLSLDLHYQINKGILEAENQIILDRFTLGERVESPSALDIPLDLAIALLEDSNGQIDVRLPISGNLDDPEFDFGQIIGKAISGFISKIITAPFRLLAALVGHRDEKLDTVVFEPGRSRLLPPEEEKLARLADALHKRPQLVLGVNGGYSTEGDDGALREFAVRREVAVRSGMADGPGNPPSPLNLSNPSAQRALDVLSAERLPAAVLEKMRAQFSKSLEVDSDQSKQTGPDPVGYYRSVYLRLVEQEPPTEVSLKNLAQARVEAVIEHLTTSGTLDRSRITDVKISKTEEDKAGMIPLKFQVSVPK